MFIALRFLESGPKKPDIEIQTEKYRHSATIFCAHPKNCPKPFMSVTTMSGAGTFHFLAVCTVNRFKTI